MADSDAWVPCRKIPSFSRYRQLRCRHAGFLAAKALMKDGGISDCNAPRHPWPPLHPATRERLLDIAHRLNPLVLRRAQ